MIRAGTWRDLKRSSRAFLHRLELKTQISAQVEPVQLFTIANHYELEMCWTEMQGFASQVSWTTWIVFVGIKAHLVVSKVPSNAAAMQSDSMLPSGMKWSLWRQFEILDVAWSCSPRFAHLWPSCQGPGCWISTGDGTKLQGMRRHYRCHERRKRRRESTLDTTYIVGCVGSIPESDCKQPWISTWPLSPSLPVTMPAPIRTARTV